MLDISDQVNKLFIKGTKYLMTTSWRDVILEHEGMCVAFFIYGIRFKPISYPIVDNNKLVFVVSLEPNTLFIYGISPPIIT